MGLFDDILYGYQFRFEEDDSNLKIWLAARQIGKSFGVSAEAVKLAAEKARQAVLLVSASQRQSHELLQKCVRWAEALKVAVDPEIVLRETTEELRLANGSRILSLPASPDTIRGFSGHVFLDEFAFHKDSRRIWAAVFPIVTRGFKLRITSTPNGKQNMFYQLWSNRDPHWSRHLTTIHQAIDDGLQVDLDELKAGVPDQETWAQEYECKFIDEATAFLPYDLISTCEADKAGRPGLTGMGPCYVGMDIGRRKDFTVIWVLEKVGDVYWTREVSVMKRASFRAQDDELDRIVRDYHPVRVCMDQTGLGEKMVEDAQNRYGRSRVEGVLFSGPVKHDLALGLRRVFEDRQIRVPIDRDLREDLHSIKKMVTAAGNVRYDAERTGDGHGDRFWAAALAMHATDEVASMPQILSLPRKAVVGVKYAGF